MQCGMSSLATTMNQKFLNSIRYLDAGREMFQDQEMEADLEDIAEELEGHQFN